MTTLNNESLTVELPRSSSSSLASVTSQNVAEIQKAPSSPTKPRAVLLGQLLSLWFASTGAIQSKLYLDCRRSAPMFSSLSFYFPLSVICLGWLMWEEEKDNAQSKSSSQHRANGGVDDKTSGCEDLQGKSLGNENEKQGSTILVAKHERRNHLLSRWSRNPTISENANDPSSTVNDNIDSVAITVGSASQTSSQDTKPYSFFGLIPLRTSPRKYAMIAFFDVYASYTTILAFRYTTITSVALFDAFGIPSAIIVSRYFFRRRYTTVHLLGVLVCCVGIALNVLLDYRADKKVAVANDGASAQVQSNEDDYPHKIAGDSFAIIGGILFGIASTLQEVTVKDGALVEYLGCFTFFASIIAFIQAILTERQEIAELFSPSASDSCSESEGELLFMFFAIGSMVRYVANGAFLQLSDAAFFNLSLLTGDAWAVAFSVFAEGIVPSPSFYAALFITLTGVVIYETAPSPVIKPKKVKVAAVDIELTEHHRIGSDDLVEIKLTEDDNKII